MARWEEERRTRCRVRDLGLSLGHYDAGPNNAITDVPGVRVGHSTLIHGQGRLVAGRGPVRTGVTAILPNAHNVFEQRVVGGGFILNGAGEVSGLTQVIEWGLIETPILLTSTLSVGKCSAGLVQYMVERYPSIGRKHDVIIPLVGECDDSWLNDAGGNHIGTEHVYDAIASASDGVPAEGNVGAGTGMVTCDFAGGVGTSSRVLPKEDGGYTLGVFVLSNFGRLVDLRFDGIPVGEILAPHYGHIAKRRRAYGSIIAVVATNAPLWTHQLSRICKRVALGIGRVGSYAAHGSGEIIFAFSNANTLPREKRSRVYNLKILADHRMDALYRGVIEATEEAILNALCMSVRMEGANHHFAPDLPIEMVRDIIARYQAPPLKGKLPPPLRSPESYVGPLQQLTAAKLPERAGSPVPGKDVPLAAEPPKGPSEQPSVRAQQEIPVVRSPKSE